MAITILFLHCRRCQNSMKQFSPEKWKYASSKNITTIKTCMSHNNLLEHGHFDYSLILQFCISFVVDEGNWVIPIYFFHPFHLQKWQYTTLTLPIPRPLFVERFSQYLSLIANPARVYPSFLSIRQLGVLQLPPWMGCLSITMTAPQHFIRLPW